MKNSKFPVLKPKGNKKYPIFTDKKPSDQFAYNVINESGPVFDCELCGRVHFSVQGEHMEDGELEGLLKKRKINPRKYIGRNGSIYYGKINGLQAVYDCPCNGLRIYENFIWNNIYLIAKYLQERTKENLEEAQRDERASKNITAATS